MTILKRLQREANANRPKAILLGVLLLGLCGVLVRPFLKTLPEAVGLPGVFAAATPSETAEPLWRQMQAAAAGRGDSGPLAADAAIRNAFAIDDGQFSPPLLFAEDAIAPRSPKLTLPKLPERIEASPDAPEVSLDATLAGRTAILDGRLVRLNASFFADDEPFRLTEVGDGWVVVQAEEGTRYRIVVDRVYRAAGERLEQARRKAGAARQ